MTVLLLLFIILAIMFIASIKWLAIIPIFIMLCILAYVSDHMDEQEKKQK